MLKFKKICLIVSCAFITIGIICAVVSVVTKRYETPAENQEEQYSPEFAHDIIMSASKSVEDHNKASEEYYHQSNEAENMTEVEPEEIYSAPAVHNDSPNNDAPVNVAMVELKPVFPGGESEMYRWIAENLNYPVEAIENGVSGRVVVDFKINKDGTISNARVVRSRHPALDREAIRLVNSMPRWTPGRNNGEPVNVTYILPITFRLP